MDIQEFQEEIKKIEKSYNMNFDSEKVKLYWDEFKDVDYTKFSSAINSLIKTNKYIPNIAEIHEKLNKYSSVRNYNLDSSYWYANLRDIKPYFNIYTGEPLEPFKD